MIHLIEDIIDRFGGRLAGSDAEQNAQAYMQNKLNDLGAKTEIHTFQAALRAKPQALKIFIFLYWVSLVLCLFNLFWLALVLASINTIFFTGSFVLFQDWVDGLFPTFTSWNLTATLEPEGSVEQTIIVAGHIDSTREFIWWYWFKNFGMVLMLISGFSVLLFPFGIISMILLGYHIPTDVVSTNWVWLVFAVLSPSTLSMFFMRSNRVVPGAQDNLSAISVAYHVLEAFTHPEKNGKNTLKHTRLKMVSFGSEETGLKGSKAYVEEYETILKAENARIINMDGIMNMEEFSILDGELMTRIQYDETLRKALQNTFDQKGIKYKTGKLTVGATDGAPFIEKGIPAVTVLGLPTNRLDPTYHTRLDVPEFIDPKALETCRDVLISTIQKSDQDLRS